jgi:hypothetical protein
VLDESIKNFGESGSVVSARELVDKYHYIRGFLTKGLLESPIERRDYREECYLQLKALDTLMNTLITNGWK